MLTITRTFEFCAGHRLYRPDWTPDKNKQIFGLCSNEAGHGHNYTLEVSVTGPIDPETGMIMNLRELKETVRDRVISEVDHKNLNIDVAWMRDVIPTTEQFADRIWIRLEEVLRSSSPHVRLSSIVLHETSNNKVCKTATL